MAPINILHTICFVYILQLYALLLLSIFSPHIFHPTIQQENNHLPTIMCLNNCIKSIVPDINYDPLEISCFNPVYEDTCDYIEIDETCHLSVKEEDLVFLQFNC